MNKTWPFTLFALVCLVAIGVGSYYYTVNVLQPFQAKLSQQTNC